ncbi:MAG: penicillin-binding protein activator LpoB [Elusimicrobiota bacterium]|nr:penicillin-binding protein activator LpoB [Elusimicrobiota bacterium]
MKLTGIFVIISAAAGAALSSGCAGKDVVRLESDVEIDLSGRWNDTDSKLVAGQLISEMLDSRWHRQFKSSAGRSPVVIVGRVVNKTMEHIPVQPFVKDLERAMINSGLIEIVAAADERKEVRSERKEMQKWASLNSRKDLMQEKAADFMLKGVLNSIVDEEGGERVVFYQADLSLINTENNSIIWTGQKQIKKYIKRTRFRL